MFDISGLNENQREAVEWANGPLLVLAGPGSGKTHVLTSRIAKILEESTGQYFRILGLTFTNKAAGEMRSRIEKLVPSELGRVRLTTFHSYAAELLQQHGSHLNIRPDFQILSNDVDRIALLDEVLSEMHKDLEHPLPVHFTSSQLLPAITRLLEMCIPDEKVEKLLADNHMENAGSLANVYISYRKALRHTNSLDFPSLIIESIELLRNFSFLRKHIRKVYKHILVDEFQDTNSSQYQFLSYIVSPDPSTLFIVADDDQIIYEWNGANQQRFQDLKNEFNVSILQLPENYRCPAPVIELANELIVKNQNRAIEKKPLKAVKECHEDNIIRIYKFNELNDEIIWIANDILARPPEEKCKCAILARTNKLLGEVEKIFSELGIKVYLAVRKNEFLSPPMVFLYSILRLVNSREDKQSLTRLLKSFYEIEGIRIELSQVISRASSDGQGFLDAWLKESELRMNDIELTTRLLLKKDIRYFMESLKYKEFFINFIEWSKGNMSKGIYKDNVFNEFEEELKVWNILYSEILGKFEGEDLSLYQLLHELDLSSKTPPKPIDAIPCFTIHASKGMEFGHVYLMGMVEDQLPTWTAIKKGDNSPEMQEERRNCFVAITRAQESLTMTYSTNVFNWDKRPSRFFNDMGIKL